MLNSPGPFRLLWPKSNKGDIQSNATVQSYQDNIITKY